MAFSGGQIRISGGILFDSLSTMIDLTTEELSIISLLEMKTYNNNDMRQKRDNRPIFLKKSLKYL